MDAPAASGLPGLRGLAALFERNYHPSVTRRITSGDIQRFVDLHGEAVVSLEKAIYILDSLLVSAAMADVAKIK